MEEVMGLVVRDRHGNELTCPVEVLEELPLFESYGRARVRVTPVGGRGTTVVSSSRLVSLKGEKEQPAE